ncbi:MAG: aldolase/citrate lyase family protein [Neglectibacter sp.]
MNTPPLPEHWASHNRETLMIPMCETRGCLEAIEEIAALEGVDGIFVGPCDLSIALGKPGAFDDPEVNAAFEREWPPVKRPENSVWLSRRIPL